MAITTEDLKNLLVSPGHIKEEDFEKILERTEKVNQIKKILVEEGYISEENLGTIIADAIGYPFVDLRKVKIPREMVEIVPEVVAKSQMAIVFEKTPGEVLKLATTDPENYEFIGMLEKKTEKQIKSHYAPPSAIEASFKLYGEDLEAEINKLSESFKEDVKEREESVVKMVDLFLEHASASLASDIHIEPLSDKVMVRYRIDGVLYKVADYSKNIHPKVVSRIKILSQLRTDEHAAPQDGRFSFEKKDVSFDARVSIMPVTEGENVVIRILVEEGQRLSLEDLGLSEDNLKKVKRASSKSYGMILAVGPTGSGKTTSLYGILQFLNNIRVNIMTIEDPVEYNIDGVQQTQTNPQKELTFSTGLRSIVRQDPDVIMVGEIRDSETADIAINSAMTVHLVLSTMHTNDAATTFPRLLEMGVEPFLIASSINVIVAQRLVRRICEKCRKSTFLNEKEVAFIEEDKELSQSIRRIAGKDNLFEIRFYHGEGCQACSKTGFSGRSAIFEVLEVNESIRLLIAQKASSEEIKRKAMEEGMASLLHDGVSKALIGETSILEVVKAAKST